MWIKDKLTIEVFIELFIIKHVYIKVLNHILNLPIQLKYI